MTNVGYALLLSPIFGFFLSALLLLIMKFVVRKPALYTAPTSNSPPPLWIRGLLIFTCTGVSFFHGSNDGQKGMGLIMLILIGVAPTAYALNRTLPESHMAAFAQASDAASKVIEAQGAGFKILGDPRPVVTAYVHDHKIAEGTYPALAVFVKNIAEQVDPIWLARQGSVRESRQHPQRHVSGLRSASDPRQGQAERPEA